MNDSLLKADIFFIITSISVIAFSVCMIVAFIYLAQALRSFKRLADILSKNANGVGEEVKDLVQDIRQSTIFSFLFHKKKSRGKSKN